MHYVFDIDFKKLPFSLEYPQYDLTVKKPNNWEKFIGIAEILSKDERFLRVDFYDCDLPIVGELTLHPEAGRGRFNPDNFDLIIGKYFNEKIIN